MFYRHCPRDGRPHIRRVPAESADGLFHLAAVIDEAKHLYPREISARQHYSR